MDVRPTSDFKHKLDQLAEKWAPPGRAGDFMLEISQVVVAGIQAGRSAAQGESGLIMCGACNKIFDHECPKK